MFSTILIANRGEIACRVIRTARRMGIRCVAVYSDADRDALHVAMADEAYRIGPAPARESYLRAEKIIEAAQAAGAEAIHPGYGFLSENASFAEACAAAGIAFIGPPASAIRAMGGKSEAKALMERAGVPLVPGYHGEDQDAALLAREAEAIGFPVLIKASAGGGGKGMKSAAGAAEFADALASAKREAMASFGDDRVLLERHLQRPRHVEIQVFADAKGNCVYLFERDCSTQRRHQKVIEEAPAPRFSADTRRRMGEAAVAAAKAVGYVGAGTVEFLFEPATGNFYFMEMNTRLQVEHPVTEMVTGLDLVEWQLRVASGEALPRRQDELAINGHSIEVRLYAEDPSRDFLPQTGRLDVLEFPPGEETLRIETGVRGGDAISIYYDPMIAKIVAWGADRHAAAARLRRALAETRIVGLTTNLPFLSTALAHPAFLAGDIHTGFIDERLAQLAPPPRPASAQTLALATLGLLLNRASEAEQHNTADPHSPWGQGGGWRMNLPGHETVRLQDPAATGERAVEVSYRADGMRLTTDGSAFDVTGRLSGDRLEAELSGRRMNVRWYRFDDTIAVIGDGLQAQEFRLHDPIAEAGAAPEHGSGMRSPMPGRIIALLAEPGDAVAAGQALVILEAMKMEHTIRAPLAGTVKGFRYRTGEQVEEGVELVEFEVSS